MANPNAKAHERTVDMFTGKTIAEEVQAASEEVLEAPKTSEPIEVSAEHWRSNAFYTAEFLSKHWDEALQEGDSKFRITVKNGLYLLERFQMDRTGKFAYQWTGVMFKEDDLYELTNVLTQASKNKRDRERSGVVT